MASEWSNLITNWRSRIQTVNDREQILEAFSMAIQDVLSSRSRQNSVIDILSHFIWKKASINAVTLFIKNCKKRGKTQF